MSNTFFEEISTTGKELVDKVKELVDEGNVRRVTINNKKGKTLLEVPLSLGVVGLGAAYALAPFLSAISFFALYLTDCSLVVERYTDEDLKKGKSVESDEVTVIEIVENEEKEKH